MELLRQEMANYSDVLIIVGILVLAILSVYSRYFKKK